MRFGKALCMVYNTSKMQPNDIFYLQKVMYNHQEFFCLILGKKVVLLHTFVKLWVKVYNIQKIRNKR